MRNRIFSVMALLLLTIVSRVSHAGFIGGIALEDKGVFVPVIPVKVFTSKMYIKLVSGWGARDGEEHTRFNSEKIVLLPDPLRPPVHIWNLYPVVIEVPQPLFGGQANPNSLISFFDVFMGDLNNLGETTAQPGGLPQDFQLTEATLYDGAGAAHNGTITPINDLANLPTSSFFDVAVNWDLSDIPLENRQGSFYLVEYQMTANQLGLQVMEPSSLALLTLGGLILFRRRRI